MPLMYLPFISWEQKISNALLYRYWFLYEKRLSLIFHEFSLVKRLRMMSCHYVLLRKWISYFYEIYSECQWHPWWSLVYYKWWLSSTYIFQGFINSFGLGMIYHENSCQNWTKWRSYGNTIYLLANIIFESEMNFFAAIVTIDFLYPFY